MREDGRPPAIGEHGGTSSRRTTGTGTGATQSTETQQAPPAAALPCKDKDLAEAAVCTVRHFAHVGPLAYTHVPQLYFATAW
jgi:hypothetical protein